MNLVHVSFVGGPLDGNQIVIVIEGMHPLVDSIEMPGFGVYHEARRNGDWRHFVWKKGKA